MRWSSGSGETANIRTESGGFGADGGSAGGQEGLTVVAQTGRGGNAREVRMKKDAAAAAAVASAHGTGRKKRRESAREKRRVLEIRLLHRTAEWEKPKALVTFLYVNLGRCTFRPGYMVGGPNRWNVLWWEQRGG